MTSKAKKRRASYSKRFLADIETLHTNQKGTPEKNLAVLRPDLAKQWHPTLNGKWKPEDISGGNTFRVYWMCSNTCAGQTDCIHVWHTTAEGRFKSTSKCPFCSPTKKPHKPCCKDKSLAAEKYQALHKEWDFKANGDPRDYHAKSSKKVWWICPKVCSDEGDCQHRWTAAISQRTLRKTGCPYCSRHPNRGLKPCCVFNSMAHKRFEHLHPQWDSTANPPLTDVMPNSNQKMWWICPKTCEGEPSCRHRWQAQVRCRTYRKRGCRFCTNVSKVPCCKKNSLDCEEFAHLKSQWNEAKSGPMRNYYVKSEKKVEWRCPNTCPGQDDCKHVWVTSIAQRTYANKQSGCPHCNGGCNNVSPCCKERSLAAEKYKHLVPDWDEETNGPMRNWFPGSSKKATWICKEHGKWNAVVGCRALRDYGCPVCNTSHMEKQVNALLLELLSEGNTMLEKFKWGKTTVGGKLRPDFIGSAGGVKFIIETDGEQHFQAIPYWGGQEKFEKVQLSDAKKNKFCKDNGYALLRISYTVLRSKYKKILENFFEEIHSKKHVFIGEEY